MATSEKAGFLEEEGEFGVVQPGARSDLILVEGDPLSELSVLREPVGVMVSGHWRIRAQIIDILEFKASTFEIPLKDKVYFLAQYRRIADNLGFLLKKKLFLAEVSIGRCNKFEA